jgi:hypothetical protein
MHVLNALYASVLGAGRWGAKWWRVAEIERLFILVRRGAR